LEAAFENKEIIFFQTGEWFLHSFCVIHWPRTFWPIRRPLDEQPLPLATNVRERHQVDPLMQRA
jgi:hypothetical protein